MANDDVDDAIEMLVAFLNGIPFYLDAQGVASDLVSLAKHGASWPKLSLTVWKRAIAAGVATGKLVVDGLGRVGLPAPIGGDGQPKQMELFQ